MKNTNEQKKITITEHKKAGHCAKSLTCGFCRYYHECFEEDETDIISSMEEKWYDIDAYEEFFRPKF